MCFHVRLQNEWFGDSTTIEETAIHLIKHILKTLSPIITTNQLNRDLQSQVTGVLQSNAGSSSSTGFFSLAYQRDQPPNSWNLPISLPYFWCGKVLVMSLVHPQKNWVDTLTPFKLTIIGFIQIKMWDYVWLSLPKWWGGIPGWKPLEAALRFDQPCREGRSRRSIVR